MGLESVITCPRCKGDGVVPDDGTYTEGLLDWECPACFGVGYLEIQEDEDDDGT